MGKTATTGRLWREAIGEGPKNSGDVLPDHPSSGLKGISNVMLTPPSLGHTFHKHG